MLKNKFLLIRVVLGVLIILISVLTFLGIGDKIIMMSSILILLGLLQFFNGVYFLSKNSDRKGYGIFLIISAIVLICIGISFMFIMFK
ncbi:MAG: hypothetical protein ABF633_17935 [Clostridium sp.]|uniref:hypothetical protein n=1 Tax=Clostridium sp. TaxID=1506 RepID=UPI0039EB9A17